MPNIAIQATMDADDQARIQAQAQKLKEPITRDNPVRSRNNFDPLIKEKIDLIYKKGPPIEVDDQKWAIVVVIGPEGCRQKNVIFCFQMLGVFDTHEAAQQHSTDLFEAGYQFFDMHIMPMYKFLPFPPNTKKENVVYVEPQMKSIMDGYRDGEVYAAKALRQRVAFNEEEEMRATKQLLESVGKDAEAKAMEERFAEQAKIKDEVQTEEKKV